MVNSSNKESSRSAAKYGYLHGNHSKSVKSVIFFIPKRKGLFLRVMVLPPKEQLDSSQAAAEAGKPRGLLWLRNSVWLLPPLATPLRVSVARVPHTAGQSAST